MMRLPSPARTPERAILTAVASIAFALVALLTFLPAVSALAFTAPTNGSTFVENATVTFIWDESPVTFSLTGRPDETVNGTGLDRTLAAGTYTATITNATNATASVSFTVNATTPPPPPPPPTNTTQVIGVSTDAALYEIGSSARIRVTVTEPEQLSLVVTRPNGPNDTYTISVTSQTDFLYATTVPGLHAISVRGQSSGAAAASSFTVQNTSMTVQITGGTSGTAGRVTSFGSIVQGGTAPLQYRWQFSDNTTSTGSSTDHVFDRPGNYTTTLVVTDAIGRSASASRNVTIVEGTYRLTVNVLGNNSRLLRNASVVVTPATGGASRTGITDDLGRVRFSNLTASPYRVNVTYVANELSPLVTYTDNRSVNLSDDTAVTVILPVPDPALIAAAANATPNSTASNTTTNRTTVPMAASTASPSATAAPSPTALSAPPSASDASLAALKEDYERTLVARKASAEDELRDREAAIARSDVRSEIARLLDLTERFEQAGAAIRDATTEEAIDRALDSAPRDITILSRDSTASTRDPEEALADIDRYVAAVGAQGEDAENLRYTLERSLEGFTVTTRRSVVRVTAVDGSSETFTIIEREAPRAEGVSYVEFIPQAFASDVTELTITGSHEIIDTGSLIRFVDDKYSYSTRKVTEDEPTVLRIPDTIAEKPGVIGLVAVKLNLASGERGTLYLAVVAFLAITILGGNLLLRARNGSNVDAFTDAARLALDAAERGNPATLAATVKELEAIAASLTPDERASVTETLAVLKEAAADAEFRSAIEHCRNAIALDDTVAMAAAYERVLAAHGSLSPEARMRTDALVEGIHAAVDEHVSAKERTGVRA